MVHGSGSKRAPDDRTARTLAARGYSVAIVSMPDSGFRPAVDLSGPASVTAASRCWTCSRKPKARCHELVAGVCRAGHRGRELAARRMISRPSCCSRASRPVGGKPRNAAFGLREPIVAEAGQTERVARALATMRGDGRGAVLVIHGEKDSYVPPAGEPLVAALEARGAKLSTLRPTATRALAERWVARGNGLSEAHVER